MPSFSPWLNLLSALRMCVCRCLCTPRPRHTDPHRHSRWPQLLQLHYPSSRGKRPRLCKGLFCHGANTPHAHPTTSAFYRCMLLEDGQWAKNSQPLPSTLKEAPNLETEKRAGAESHTSLPRQAAEHLFLAPLWLIPPTLPLFQSAALPSPLPLSTTLSPTFYPPLSPLLHFQTENVRWANAIHSLTKGKLGLLQQGSDRLVPEARFSFSLSPLTRRSAPLSFFSHLLIRAHARTHAYKVKLRLREPLLTVEVIKKTYNSLWLFSHC